MNGVAFLLSHAVFTTRQYAMLCESRVDAASRQLARLSRLGRGRSRHAGRVGPAGPPAFHAVRGGAAAAPQRARLRVVPFRDASAWLLAQIPGSIQVATTGHTRCLTTPFARYEFLRIQPSMMREGVATSATDPAYNIATAAKALLDALYIATRKGRRFASLPEVDMNEVSKAELRRLLDRQVRATPIHRAITARIAELACVEARR